MSAVKPAMSANRKVASDTAAHHAADFGNHVRMTFAAELLTLILMIASVVGVAIAFWWAAKKDGEDDDAIQRRLGIRRKTRLGR